MLYYYLLTFDFLLLIVTMLLYAKTFKLFLKNFVSVAWPGFFIGWGALIIHLYTIHITQCYMH
jgi:hypothetical protein